MKAHPAVSSRLRRLPRFVVTLAMAVLVSAALFQTARALVTPPAPPLGTAVSYAVVGGSSVTFGGAPNTVNGNIGIAPGSSITGSPNILPPFANNGLVTAVQTDVTALETAIVGLSGADSLLPELNGQSLVPGLYALGAATLSAGPPLILNGPGVFIFQVSSSLTSFATSTVQLNNVDPCQVFWQCHQPGDSRWRLLRRNVIVAKAGRPHRYQPCPGR